MRQELQGSVAPVILRPFTDPPHPSISRPLSGEYVKGKKGQVVQVKVSSDDPSPSYVVDIVTFATPQVALTDPTPINIGAEGQEYGLDITLLDDLVQDVRYLVRLYIIKGTQHHMHTITIRGEDSRLAGKGSAT